MNLSIFVFFISFFFLAFKFLTFVIHFVTFRFRPLTQRLYYILARRNQVVHGETSMTGFVC
ncbi:Uncharacterized protein TCM_026115 isoform 1 [Theobroma cacao]|uniref:Uncharacterized protein isoform 1 n=2 Tax=Theobroma cacao TaxID=3641 RepID=A0A061F180_THECC|nr:Uncharacterized protein TCM_026115 isoform 1 [Theobroma cacao]